MSYVEDGSIGNTPLATPHSSEFYSDPHRSASTTGEETAEADMEDNKDNEPLKYDLPTMMEALQITKDPEDETNADLVGKYLPCYEINDERGLWRREWVCSRQRYRHERPGSVKDNRRRKKEVSWCGCKATLHVLKEFGQEMWWATVFVPEHKHPLTAQDHLRFLHSNRKITEAQTAQIQTYRLAGIKICDIVNLMVQQSGGYQDLGFTKKDCYNKVADLKRSNKTDAEGLLGYLKAKMDSSDPTLFAKYAVDDEDMLCHVFWSNTASQRDYACFSDALAFNTKYRTNAFNKPLVIFVGVNHHFRTTVFGFALLMNETIETYV
ncbi:hypothetical protein UlMin_032205 [Ulmus minor]